MLSSSLSARKAGLFIGCLALLRPPATAFFAHAATSTSKGSSRMTDPSAPNKDALMLEKGNVVPEILPPFQPKVSIRVSYDSHHIRVGDKLLPVQAVHVPRVSLEGSENGKLYTLVMSDPDAPSPNNPTHREWLHWLVTDIEGGAEDIAGGHQVVPYAPPTPPKGNHRYVFSAFEQPGSLTIHAPAARGQFHTKDFGKKHGLELVGATYFTAAHQE